MPVDPSRLNAVGDLVLTDSRELRALGDPLRLTLFDLVRREEPADSAALAQRLGQDPAAVEAGLRELEHAGLVDSSRSDDGELRWSSDVKGIYFEIPEDDPDAQLAARRLSSVMLAKYAELPVAWTRHQEPELGLEWARAAGLFNARVDLTPAELRAVQEDLERLLAPFTTRAAEDVPEDAAPVRILSFFMPQAVGTRPSRRGA